MFPTPDEADEVSVDQLAALRAAEIRFRLVDCREADEFAYCRIDGAEWIPLSGFTGRAENCLGPDLGQAVVVYCHHGLRSLQATRYLRRRGYTRTFSLRGGIEAWSTVVDPDVPRY